MSDRALARAFIPQLCEEAREPLPLSDKAVRQRGRGKRQGKATKPKPATKPKQSKAKGGLSKDEQRAIRQLHAAGHSVLRLSRLYSVAVATIRRVLKRGRQ